MNVKNAIKTCRLDEVCHVFQGLSVSRQEGEGLERPLVQIRDIDAGCLKLDEMARITIDERGIQDFGLKRGDVLLSVKGTIGKLALVEEEGCILSSNLAAIRPMSDRALPNFIYAYLRTPVVAQQLEAMIRPSTTVKAVRITDVRELPFPLLGLDEQRRLGELALAFDEYQRRAQECAEAYGKVINGVLISHLGNSQISN